MLGPITAWKRGFSIGVLAAESPQPEMGTLEANGAQAEGHSPSCTFFASDRME